MVELEAGLLRGGSTTVNINLAMWTLAYMAIESAYLVSKNAKVPRAPSSHS
jgi:hypothetical protein